MRRIIAAAATAACLAVTGSASATALVTGTLSAPTGITGLVVDGVTYDVTFSTTGFQSPFAQGSAGDQSALTQIASVFQSAGVVGLLGDSCGSGYECIVYADSAAPIQGQPFSYGFSSFGPSGTAAGTWTVETRSGSVPPPPLGTDCYTGDYDSRICFGPLVAVAANFTAESTVPEPATLSLLGLGLAGIGLGRRKRKN